MLRNKELERFWKYVNIPFDATINECWEWIGGTIPDGYGTFRYKGESRLAHRVSYLFYKGNFKRRLKVRHTCDNTLCVNPNHLILGSQRDNVHDAINRNRYVFNKSPITLAEVGNIKELYKIYTQQQISIMTGISKSVISKVIQGQHKRYAA